MDKLIAGLAPLLSRDTSATVAPSVPPNVNSSTECDIGREVKLLEAMTINELRAGGSQPSTKAAHAVPSTCLVKFARLAADVVKVAPSKIPGVTLGMEELALATRRGRRAIATWRNGGLEEGGYQEAGRFRVCLEAFLLDQGTSIQATRWYSAIADAFSTAILVAEGIAFVSQTPLGIAGMLENTLPRSYWLAKCRSYRPQGGHTFAAYREDL